ncbi:MAG: chaperonin GroEL [Candidatus Eisenbacteria bacterium]|uniref:60 kDa chaperonin n=1 Tax=Eiseniibacteriota bacterium TaxID=2212470 RepID=A0A849SJ45_UNCEI|nr:chaperonin GroEL [Candidatus Eisenbacteria bacterium]
MGKRLVFDDDARRALRIGVEQLAGAVCVTLGPRGRNVVIERAHGMPTITNDGLGIAQEIELLDPFENLGVRLVREAAVKTGEVAGDGTTTATVLARSLVAEGLRELAAGHNPQRLRRGIERAVVAVVADLKRRARPVAGPDDLRRIATVSARHDEVLGRIVAEAFERTGTKGIVHVENGRGTTTTLEVAEGLQIEAGYQSPYFVTDAESMVARLEDPLVLVSDLKFASSRDVVPVMELAARLGRPLVIVAGEISDEALAVLVVNRLRGTVASVSIKMPGIGEARRERLEDLAVATGARLLGADQGSSLEHVTDQDLGRARRVECERELTTIVAGGGRPESLRGHVAQLEHRLQSARGSERDSLRERIARLTGGIAVIHVGGFTDIDVQERRNRVEDAIAATRSAVEEGIITGGGVALLRSQPAIDALAARDAGEAAGLALVKRALEAPLRQIAENAGVRGALAAERVRAGSGSFGFDALAGDYADLDERGVIDAARVVRCALENAASIATLVLTTDALVVEDDEGGEDGAPGTN